MRHPLPFLTSVHRINSVFNFNLIRTQCFYKCTPGVKFSTESRDTVSVQGKETNSDVKKRQNVINAPEFFSRNSSSKNKAWQTGSSSSSKLNEKKMESLKKTDDKIIWVDCEMTGLDIDKDKLMEIACIITDGNLKEIARHPAVIVQVSEDILNNMNEWCTKHHGESGLTYACKNSNVTLENADEMLVNFLKKYSYPGVCPLAGNSNHMDRLFLSRQMPKFHNHLHYRNIDVSTIKELVMRWFPEEYSKTPPKTYTHRVINDIEESIAELKYYRSAVFQNRDEMANTTEGIKL